VVLWDTKTPQWKVTKRLGIGYNELTVGFDAFDRIEVPPGLRATLYAEGGTQLFLPGMSKNTRPVDANSGFRVEPDCYVGIQAVTFYEETSDIVEPETHSSFMDGLDRHLTNQGVSSRERAINFAVAQASRSAQPQLASQRPTSVLAGALAHGLTLWTIDASRAPLSRPGSDAWDVVMVLCDALPTDGGSKLVYRTTVDVAEVQPTQIAPWRSWAVS
jgi:hypothetical protein